MKTTLEVVCKGKILEIFYHLQESKWYHIWKQTDVMIFLRLYSICQRRQDNDKSLENWLCDCSMTLNILVHSTTAYFYIVSTNRPDLENTLPIGSTAHFVPVLLINCPYKEDWFSKEVTNLDHIYIKMQLSSTYQAGVQMVLTFIASSPFHSDQDLPQSLKWSRK